MREAPSRTVISALVGMGAKVVAFDPVAQHTAHAALADDLGAGVFAPGGAVQLADNALAALDGVDALLLLTEWKCFQNPDFLGMGGRMRRKVVFDGRNVYDPAVMQELGFAYVGIGRRNASGAALLNNELTHWVSGDAHHHLSAQARDEAIAQMVAI
jgi:UDPglucose 6-dehydrogenase